MTRGESDEHTFRDLFANHVRFVGRALRYLGLPERDIPDACQEVFLVVHRRLPEYRPEAALRSWLYAICLNVARQHRRTTRRKPEDPLEDPDSEGAPPHPNPAVRMQERELALRVLDDLSDEKRAVFVLYEVEQLTMDEIVEILGCPLQTGYSRLRAAREQVAAAVKRLRARGELE